MANQYQNGAAFNSTRMLRQWFALTSVCSQGLANSTRLGRSGLRGGRVGWRKTRHTNEVSEIDCRFNCRFDCVHVRYDERSTVSEAISLLGVNVERLELNINALSERSMQSLLICAL